MRPDAAAVRRDTILVPVLQGLKSYTAYRKEWRRFVAFVQLRCPDVRGVPGRDRPWCLRVLWKFLVFRSRTNKPSSLFGIISALKYCSLFCGYLLPSSRGEQPTWARLRVHYMRRELVDRAMRQAALSGVSADPRRALAVGAAGIGVLLSGYGVVDEPSFLLLPAGVRNFIMATAMAYRGCMRFGHFSAHGYDLADFTRRGHEWRLRSNWRKLAIGSALRHRGAYTIVFKDRPALGPASFEVTDEGGVWVASLTAFMLLDWHIADRRRRADGAGFFHGQRLLVRDEFQLWLQLSFGRILPQLSQALREQLTPHSMRAGRASDLARAHVLMEIIKRQGRWASNAVEQYIRSGLAQLVDLDAGFEVIMDSEGLLGALVKLVRRYRRSVPGKK